MEKGQMPSGKTQEQTEAMLAELRAGFGAKSNGELFRLLTALGNIVLQEATVEDSGRRVLKIIGRGGRERQIVIEP